MAQEKAIGETPGKSWPFCAPGWIKETSDEVMSTTDEQQRLEAGVRACMEKRLAHVTRGLDKVVHLVYLRGMLWKRFQY